MSDKTCQIKPDKFPASSAERNTGEAALYIEQVVFTRFIASVAVVVTHYGGNVYPFNTYPINKLVPVGPLAVSYFFALSGFILAYVYSSRNNISLKKFYVSRAARIYPIYILSMLPMTYFVIRKGNFDFVSFIFNVLLLQNLFPVNFMSFNFPAWALSVEIGFYIIFPLLMIYILRYGKKSFLSLSILIWVSSQIVHVYLLNYVYNDNTTTLHEILFYGPLFHFNTFILGCAGGVLFKEYVHRISIDRLLNSVLIFLSAVAIIFILLLREEDSTIAGIKMSYTNGLMAPLFLILILLLCMDNSLIKKILSNKLFVTLGEASFCIYVFQVPVKHFFYGVLGKSLGLSGDRLFYIYFIGLLLISIFLQRHIETPFRKKIVESFRG